MNTLITVLEILNAASRPVLLLGPVDRPTAERVERLAELLGAAILLTPDAKSLIDDEKIAGIFSFGASEAARRVVSAADVVIAFCALSEFQCRSGKAFEGKRVIHVTPHASDVGRNLRPTASLVGDYAAMTALFLRALRDRGGDPQARWFAELLPFGPVPHGGRPRAGVIHPVAAIRAIESAFPREGRICLDVNSGSLHAYEQLRTTTLQRVFSSIEQSACMGEALMASIGIRLASELPTLVITGDWCQCMTPAEIHTAVEHRIGGYVVVVWSNGGGAFIGEGIRQQGHKVEDAAWRWRSRPDFTLMAQAFGAFGTRATTAVELEAAVREGLARSQPTVIEAVIDPNVPVPAGDRFLTLNQAHGATR